MAAKVILLAQTPGPYLRSWPRYDLRGVFSAASKLLAKWLVLDGFDQTYQAIDINIAVQVGNTRLQCA
jgi:hypothetical protein